MAEFISPLEVRNKLSENYDVQILDEEQIGVVLDISKVVVGYEMLRSPIHTLNIYHHLILIYLKCTPR